MRTYRELYSVLCSNLNENGREYKEEGIYVYIQLIYFAVNQQRNWHNMVKQVYSNKNLKINK